MSVARRLLNASAVPSCWKFTDNNNYRVGGRWKKKQNKSIISYNLFTLRQKTGRHYFYRAHSSYCHYNKQWIMYSVSSTGCCTQMVDVLPMTWLGALMQNPQTLHIIHKAVNGFWIQICSWRQRMNHASMNTEVKAAGYYNKVRSSLVPVILSHSLAIRPDTRTWKWMQQYAA